MFRSLQFGGPGKTIDVSAQLMMQHLLGIAGRVMLCFFAICLVCKSSLYKFGVELIITIIFHFLNLALPILEIYSIKQL